jgi:hypothetical protein
MFEGTNIVATAGSVTVDFAATGAAPGTFDIIVEKPNVNPRVVSRGFDIIDSSTSPNLLLNGDFEAPAGSNSQAWFGDYPNFRDEWAYDWVYFQYSGYKGWINSVGEWGQTEETTTWQTVFVEPGSTLNFTGWAAAVAAWPTYTGSTASVTVKLWDLTAPETLLGEAVVDTDTNPDTWTEMSIVSAPVQSGRVKVELLTSATHGTEPTDPWRIRGASARADQFVLTASTPCNEPLHAVTAVPSNGAQEQNLTMTIRGGSNLDTVPADGVKLIWVDEPQPGGPNVVLKHVDEPEIVIEGIIVSQSQTELEVTFPIADEPPLTYNLVVQKENCPTPNLEFVRVFRDSGSRNPDDWFEHQPNIPDNFIDKVEIICGVPGCDVLFNGEFEFAEAPLNCGAGRLTSPGIDGWQALDEFYRDVTDTWAPTCPRDIPAEAGPYGHFASMPTGTDTNQQAWQTVTTIPDAEYEFGGYFAGGSNGAATIRIRVVDGYDPNGPTLAEAVVQQLGTFEAFDWTFASVVANVMSDTTTVVWEMIGVSGASAVHADGLFMQLVSVLQCNDPFADVDADGDVDADDFAVFQRCHTGNGGFLPSEIEYCACLDVEGPGGGPDGDIDQGDLTFFEACASGPDVPADPACDD